ncbi:MAG: ferrous iron transport protein A [Anaerolineaceae bacterium]|nr:ferrous iron transport protein A [Anaerolineaceae bacterium]
MTTTTTLTLDQLQPGQTATVTVLHSTGLNRRRLLDLGILPGTVITVAMRSPLGDPTAYEVRGSVVALRREQSREIEITLQSAPMEEK